MNKNRLGLWSMLLGVSFMLIITSCKKYPDPPPVFEKYGDDSVPLQRKVLIISVDGVSGRALKEIAPPNINKLMDHGKYSFNVVPQTVSTDASGWVTMLTGVSFEKHRIEDSSFAYIPPSGGHDIGDAEGESQPNYPVIFNYLIPIMPKYKIAAVTPWKGLSDYLGILDNSIAVQTDEDVKDTTIALLQRMTTLGVVVVDLHDADVAGRNGLYSLADFDYRAAILKDDGYVGDIVNALKKRKTYDREDWLIMVTTNRGGSTATPEPGFMVLSNSALHREEVQKHGFNAVHLTGSNANAGYATMNPVVDGKRVYDFQQDFSLQFDVLFDFSSKSGAYPYFFGNKAQLNGGTTPGFSFLIDYDPTWTLNTTSGSKFQVKTDYTSLDDNKWHTVGITVEKSGSDRVLSVFADGVLRKQGTLPKEADLNSDIPLTIGWISGGDYIGTTVHNLKLFDKALTPEEMLDNKCAPDMSSLQAKESLVGFWACDEAGGGVFANSVSGKPSFILNGNTPWVQMNDKVPCSVVLPDDNATSIVPTLLDISANLFYWLEIQPDNDWGLQGTPWLENFEDEIYGL